MKSKKQPKLKVQYFVDRHLGCNFYIVFNEKIVVNLFNDFKNSEFFLSITSKRSQVRHTKKHCKKISLSKFYADTEKFIMKADQFIICKQIFEHAIQEHTKQIKNYLQDK